MKNTSEKLFQAITYTASLFTIIVLLAIIYSLFKEGLPFFRAVSLKEFLFSGAWYPTHENPEFGAKTLIAGSLFVTFGALLIGVPLGLGSAIYISEIAGNRMKEVAKPVVELLAGIPSVVYGLFGMAFLAPLVRQYFHLDTGLNVFTASIILGVMIVPIIASMSEDALSNVPKSIREASLALGATKIESIFRAILPAAKSGIIGSILLGFGRAVGETMVVLMVAGGSAQIPKSIFASARPMTSTIAAEMGETVIGDLHYQSLFALAILLFLLTFFSNLITELVFLKRSSR
ncbi:MAG: phosphate ABC transporter permease subunit PstC [Candidatus Cloacimonas sp.]|jgi:phosphate transport system permease protein|nr:phosphate ABC transporter permease subunit PstC [Candidatus Cloacimonas sp.]